MAISQDTANRLVVALASNVAGAEVQTALDGITALPSGQIIVGSAGGVATDVALSGDATLAASGAITLTNTSTSALASATPTTKIGYLTGAGGAVTQATNKTTGVTLSKPCGQITMNNAALAAAAEATFTVTNTLAAVGDVVLACHGSAGTSGSYAVDASNFTAGTFDLTVTNQSAGSLSEAIVINFILVKAVAA